MSETTVVEWVQKNSPYRGNTLLMHLLLASEMDESDGDCVIAAREYLATRLHCVVESIGNVEKRMVKDGYLEVRRNRRYGCATREYRLLIDDAKIHAAS